MADTAPWVQLSRESTEIVSAARLCGETDPLVARATATARARVVVRESISARVLGGEGGVRGEGSES